MALHDWKNRPAQTYQDMAMDYAKAHDYGKNGFPILSRRDNATEWAAWEAYFRFRKLDFKVELMRERQSTTVPAMSPNDFDPEYRQPSMLPDRRYGGLD